MTHRTKKEVRTAPCSWKFRMRVLWIRYCYYFLFIFCTIFRYCSAALEFHWIFHIHTSSHARKHAHPCAGMSKITLRTINSYTLTTNYQWFHISCNYMTVFFLAVGIALGPNFDDTHISFCSSLLPYFGQYWLTRTQNKFNEKIEE